MHTRSVLSDHHSRTRPASAIGLVLLHLFALAAPAAAQSLEQIPASEAADIAAIRQLSLENVRKHYPEGKPGLVRRDAHAKAHGCVRAVFQVDPDLPEALRAGRFAHIGQKRKAWIRFSNGAFHPSPDTAGDGRGMAVKIIDADPASPAPPSGPRPSHDILMISHPVFFSRDAADYRDLAEAGALTGDLGPLARYLVPSVNPARWKVRQGLIMRAIGAGKIASPLAAQYFSMAPFAFGPGRAVKYSARPCPSHPHAPPEGVDATAPDYLRDALRRSLGAAPACFELLVQERKPGMPIEDTTVEWSADLSPWRRVAMLTIPRQEIAVEARDKFCESASFNPWSAPVAHAPVGGMNRVRQAVYSELSAYRAQRNGIGFIDVEKAWDELP